MNLTSHSYKSAWQSEHIWQPEECIEIKEVGDFVNIRTITHSLSSRILSALASFFTFGRISSVGEKIRDSRVIPIHLTNEQKQIINQILQKSQPPSQIRSELEHRLDEFRVLQPPREFKGAVKPGPSEKKIKDEDKNKENDLKKDHEEPQDQNPPIESPSSEQPPLLPQNESIRPPISLNKTTVDNPPIIEEKPVIIDETPSLPPSFEEIKEQIALMRQELHSIHQEEKGQNSWLGDLYDNGCSFIVNWMPSTLLKWGQQAAETITIPLSTLDQDQFDQSFMDHWEPIIDEFRQNLDSFEQLYPEQLSKDQDFQSLKSKLNEAHQRFSDLHGYFDQCDKLTEALDLLGNQTADLGEGKLNCSTKAYGRIIQEFGNFQTYLSYSVSATDLPWFRRIEKKCLYQMQYALTQIEEAMGELNDEISAEIEEITAHCTAVKESKNLTHSLKHLQQAVWMSKKIKNDMTVFTEFLNSHSHSYTSNRVKTRVDRDLLTIQKLDKKNDEIFQMISFEDLAETLLKRLRHIPNPKETLFKHLPADDEKLSQTLMGLEFLSTLSETKGIRPLQKAIVKELGEKASTLKSSETEKIFEKSLPNRPILSKAKRKQRAKQMELINPSGLSPNQKMAWRAFFTYLQVWDILSPAMGKLIEPVAKDDYQTCLAMMRTYKDNPEVYKKYLEKARGFWGVDQEFLTTYDAYLTDKTFRIGFAMPPRDPLLQGTEPIEEEVYSLVKMVKSVTPDTVSTWLSKFLATEPDAHRLANASEWERWSYYSLYPAYREQVFEALNHNFDSMEIPSASETSTHIEKRNHFFSQMYKHIKDPNGLEAFKEAAVQAEAIWEWSPLAKEYHKYLLEQREAYLKPFEVPITTIPLGKATLNILDREINSLHEELKEVQKEAKNLSQRDLDTLATQQNKLAEMKKQVNALNSTFSIEHATEVQQNRWLRQIKNARDSLLAQKPVVQATAYSMIWKEAISIEQLKLYLNSPADQIDDALLAHALGDTSLKGTSLETIEALKLQAQRLHLLQARIDVLKTLCVENEADLEGVCAGFCNEYLNNPVFSKQLGESSIIPSLEKLTPKLSQAIELSELFLKKESSDFYKSFADKLYQLTPEDSLFFVDQHQKIAYEVINQKNGYYSIRIYNPEAPPKFHTRLIDAEGKEKALPFTEFVDIPYRWLSKESIWDKLHSLSVSSTTSEPIYEHLLTSTGGSFSDKVYEKTSLNDLSATSSSSYQLLSTLFREQKITPDHIDRFEYESQLKILKSYHEQNKAHYSQENKRDLMQQALENFASKLPKWHGERLINDKELVFTKQMLHDIDVTLDLERAKALDTYAKKSPVFEAEKLQATPLTLQGSIFIAESKASSPATLSEPVKETSFKPLAIDAPKLKPLPDTWISLASWEPKGNDLLNELGRIKQKFNALANPSGPQKDYAAVVRNFPSLIKTLSFADSAFWENINKNDIPDILSKLNAITEKYKLSVLRSSNHESIDKITLKDSLIFVHLLTIADRLNRLSLADHYIPMYHSAIETLLEDNSIIAQYDDPELLELYIQAKAYWKDKKNEKSIFEFDTSKHCEKISEGYKTNINKYFFENIDEYPALLKWISKWFQDHPTLKEEIQKEGIFDSPDYFDSSFPLWKSIELPIYEMSDKVFYHHGGDSKSDMTVISKMGESKEIAEYKKDVNYNLISKSSITSKNILPPEYINLRDLSFNIVNSLQPIEFNRAKILDHFNAKEPITLTSMILKYETSITLEITAKFKETRISVQKANLAISPLKLSELIYQKESNQRLRIPSSDIARENIHVKELGHQRTKELLTLSSVPELQVPSTLSYFSSHIYLLRNKDYQDLLHFLLFEQDFLLKELQRRPEDTKKIVDDLATFCRIGVTNAKVMSDYSTMAFFLTLNHKLSNYVEYSQKNNRVNFPNDYTPTFIDSRMEIRKLRKEFADVPSGLSADSLQEVDLLLQKSLIETYAHNQAFTTDEAIDFLTASMNYRLFIDKGTHTTEWKEIENLLESKSLLLEQSFSGKDKEKILDSIFIAFHPGAAPPKWDPQSTFPNFQTLDKKIGFNALNGRITEHGQMEFTNPPSEIRLDPLFIKLFGNQPRLFAKLPPSSDQNQEDVYAFIGTAGRTYHVSKINRELFVQSEFDGVMYQYAEPHLLKPFHLPDALINEHQHWYSNAEKKLMITDSQTGILKHTLSAHPKEISSTELVVGQFKQNDPHASMFMRIEKPQWITALQDRSNQVKKIEFPRYGLDFTLQEVDGKQRFVTPQLHNCYLAEKQVLPSLGKMDHYLILESKTSKGELKQIVLFPQLPLESLQEGPQTLTRPKLPDEMSNLKYLTYEVNPKDGKLIVKTHEERFYLAMMRLLEHDYESAYELLTREISQLKAYSKESVEILNWISQLENKDSHPKANAVRLKALAAGLRNHMDFVSSAKNSPLILNQSYDRVLNDYAHYLQVKDQTQTVQLSRADEILIIRTCQHRLDPTTIAKHQQIAHRMKKLNLPEEFALAASTIKMKPFALQHQLDFNQISLKSLYPEGKEFDSTIFDMYPLIHGSSTLSNHELLDLMTKLTNEQPSYFSFLWPQRMLLSRLQSILQQKQQEAKTPEEALPFLMLEAALVKPEKLPDDLNFLKTAASMQEKSDWVRKRLLVPIQSMIAKQESYQGTVQGVPQKLESIKIPTPNAIDSELDVSIPISQTPTEIPLPIDPQKLFRKTFTNTLPVEQASEKLLTLFNVELNDVIAKQEVEALKKQIKEFVLEDPEATPAVYTLQTEANLQEASQQLKTESEGVKNRLVEYKKSIVDLANKLPADEIKRALEEAKLLAKQKTELTLDEIILFVLRRDATILRQHHEALTLTDLSKLVQLVIDYLVLNTHQQRLTYLDQLTQSVINAPNQDIANERAQILGEELHRSRAYDITKHPEYLVLESSSGMLLRENQVKGLDQLNIVHGIIGNPQHLGKVLELTMGAGKTSVFAPLISMLNSDGIHLAMLVMPTTLIESMSKDLQRTLKGFGTSLEMMKFMRDTHLDVAKLTRIVDRLNGMIVGKTPLILSNESLQAFFLKMSETINRYLTLKDEKADTTSIEQQVTLFLDALRILKTSGHVLVDEVDLILDVLKSFHFTIGKSQEINPILVSTTIDLYRHLSKIADALPIRFKFLKQKAQTLPPFSEQAYHKEVKPLLVKQIINGEFITDGEKWKAFTASMDIPWSFFIDVSDQANEKRIRKTFIEVFLNGNTSPEVINYIKAIKDPDIQDILATLKEQLNVLLPLSAPKNSREHFGPEEGKGYAKPYLLGKPSPSGTQYGTEIETLDFTCAWHLEQGISIEECKQFIESTAENIRVAYSQHPRGLNEIKEYTEFMEDYHINPLALQEGDVEKIQQMINADPNKILDIVHKYVIPKIESFESQLNADAQLFGILFDQILGMSGTLWNTATYTKLITKFFPSKTAAKTLLLLSKNSPQQVEKIPALTQFDESNLKKTIEQSLKPSIDRKSSLIDSAKFFKGIPNKTVAQQLLLIGQERNWGIKGATYYNEEDKLMVITHENHAWNTMELSESSLTPDEIVAFWDQSHCTGFDIKLSPTMEAAIFVNQHAMLRDVLQSVWRLRGLDKTQKVHFVVPDDDLQIMQATLNRVTGRPIDAELTMNEVILYTLIQQASRQGSDNYRSLNLKFNAVLLSKALTSMMEAASASEVGEIHKATKPLFEMKQVNRPADLYLKSSDIKAKEAVIKKDVEKFLGGPLMEAFRTHPLLKQRWDASKIGEEIQAIADSELKNLPHMLEDIDSYGKQRSVQTQMDTQNQQQTQKATQINIELLTQVDMMVQEIEESNEVPTKVEKILWPFSPSSVFFSSYFHHQNYAIKAETYLSTQFSNIASEFSQDLIWSQSLTHFTANENRASLLGTSSQRYQYYPYQRDQTAFNQMLLVQNKHSGKLQALLLSAEDAKSFKEMLEADRECNLDEDLRLAIYDFETGIYAQGSDEDRISDAELKASKHFQMLRVQAKFLRGDLTYSKMELTILKEWLKSSQNPKELEAFFLKKVAPWKGISKEAYKKSDLAYVFHEFKNWVPPAKPRWFDSFWKVIGIS